MLVPRGPQKPDARGGEERREHQRGAVDHRRVDHLADAGALAFEQRGDDAVREQHAAAGEVADDVERRGRRLARAAERLERAGDRDVVDVVAGHRARTGRPARSR